MATTTGGKFHDPYESTAAANWLKELDGGNGKLIDWVNRAYRTVEPLPVVVVDEYFAARDLARAVAQAYWGSEPRAVGDVGVPGVEFSDYMAVLQQSGNSLPVSEPVAGRHYRRVILWSGDECPGIQRMFSAGGTIRVGCHLHAPPTAELAMHIQYMAGREASRREFMRRAKS